MIYLIEVERHIINLQGYIFFAQLAKRSYAVTNKLIGIGHVISIYRIPYILQLMS